MMKELNQNQIQDVNGGGAPLVIGLVIVGVLVAEDVVNFVEGVVDGASGNPRVNN